MQRWKTMDHVFMIVLGLIVVFGWMDAKQIITFHSLNSDKAWCLYNSFTGPAIWITWWIVLLAIGLIWYMVYKDKSEAVALSLAGMIMLAFGVEDVIFFIFSDQVMTSCMSWFVFPQNLVSQLLGETCVSPSALLLNAALGVVIALFLYNKLKVAKW